MQGLTRFHFTLNLIFIVLLELKWWRLYVADSFALISSLVIRKKFYPFRETTTAEDKSVTHLMGKLYFVFLTCLEIFQLISSEQVNVFLQQVSKHVALCPQK